MWFHFYMFEYVWHVLMAFWFVLDMVMRDLGFRFDLMMPIGYEDEIPRLAKLFGHVGGCADGTLVFGQVALWKYHARQDVSFKWFNAKFKIWQRWKTWWNMMKHDETWWNMMKLHWKLLASGTLEERTAQRFCVTRVPSQILRSRGLDA